MSIPDWLATSLQHTAQNPALSAKSGYKIEVGTKVGTAESLTQQGFQGFVPTVPTVPTKKQSPGKTTETGGNAPAVAANDADTGHPIPDDLPGLVSRVATLEGWPQELQAEHLAIIRRQLVSGECDADTIRAGWLAHIDRWHNVREAIEERAAIMEYDGGVPRKQAEELAAADNQCLACCHWRGELTTTDDRTMALSLVGVKQAPRASRTMGICAKRYKPWRVSNIPGDADYSRWHIVGHCGWEAGQGRLAA